MTLGAATLRCSSSLSTHVWIALRSKYGRDGVTRIKSALDRLVRADAVRGVTTRIVAIDDGRTARTLGIKAVSDPTDAKSAKLAVDAIDALWNPHYFVLVGSDDVIPTQPLKNPLYQPGPTALDSDLLVPSDLPYASDYEFTTQIAHYRGATRVVGRIADGHGSKSTAQLRRALGVAAGAVARPRKHYERPWVLTAADWNQSTRQTLDRVYGPGTEFMEVPPAEKWRLGDTRRLMHIFNCHGVDSAPQLQGQKGWFRPIAMNSDVLLVPGRLSEGTVVASECCYTGQMMAPDPKRGLAWVDTYLRAGAYGFLGSSTEVWGGITTNQDADYLVRYYMTRFIRESAK